MKMPPTPERKPFRKLFRAILTEIPPPPIPPKAAESSKLFPFLPSSATASRRKRNRRHRKSSHPKNRAPPGPSPSAMTRSFKRASKNPERTRTAPVRQGRPTGGFSSSFDLQKDRRGSHP